MTPGRLVRAAFAAALWCLLSACAAWMPLPQTAALQRAAPPDMPRSVENSRAPFFPQTPLHCGPAALATALGHVGLAADPQALADAVFLPARGGSLQLEMVAAARRQGVLVTRLPGELEALFREVAAGQVVVLLQNLGLAMAPTWHYAVLVGYDLDAGHVVLRSGTTERELLPIHTFERTWARADRWAVTLLPPGRLPATAAPEEALAAAVAFERQAAPAQAALAYASLVRRWPEVALAGIGLGNSLHAAGDTEGAMQAFEAVAQRHNSAVAWNNLARLRLAAGHSAEALAAAQRAVARAALVEPAWLLAAQATLALAQQAAAARQAPTAAAPAR